MTSSMPVAAAAISFSFAASLALLVVLALLAAALSFWVYRHTVPEVGRGRRAVLISLRAAALALLLFLLFEPVLNLSSTESLPPRVAVLLDNSRSMTVRDDAGERSSSMRSISGADEISGLPRLGAASFYLFGGKGFPLQSFTPDSLTFTAGETDIASVLQQTREELAERNLRAIVLVSDGNVTTGKNPLHAAEEAGVPVFVVGVGDSTEKKDVLVSRVLANSIGYVESNIPVDAVLRSAGYGGETVTVTLLEGSKALDRRTLLLQDGSVEYPLAFRYTPGTEGVKKLTVAVSPTPGELTERNNRSTVYVKVLKNRMKVAVLAGAPSPDVSFLEQVFARDRNVEAKFYVQRLGASWYGEAPSQQALEQADCIVLAGFPLPRSGAELMRQLRAALEKKNTPLLILPSRETDLRALRSDLEQWTPFDVVQTRQEETQIFFEAAPDAATHPVLSSGIPSGVWRDLPPLFRTESSFKARAGARTLATMRISNVAFDEPVLIARSLRRSKTLAFTAYGLWRWQLAHEVLDGRLPDILVSNGIRWLTAREDEKKVRIRPLKEFFDNGEAAVITAQVYNESYEPLEDAEVMVKISGSAADLERDLVLSPIGAGRYVASLEGLGEGDYTFTGAARREGNELGRDEGRFTVGEPAAEFLETRMNNVLLRQIAARTGGRFFHAADITGLQDAVSAAPDFIAAERENKRDIQLWNLAWLLAAAVLLFAVEWYLRKQSGMI